MRTLFKFLSAPYRLRLYVLAHTQVQVDIFVRKNSLPREQVKRVLEARDIEGVDSKLPLILLPGYMESRNADEILAVWSHRGAGLLRVSEAQALGCTPLCPNDTDGDGDCEVCHRRGGCFWPNTDMTAKAL